MSSDRLKKIAIALVAVLFLWVLVEIIRPRGDTIAGGFSLPSVNQAEVKAVEFRGPRDTILLARSPTNQWTVNGYEASEQAVSDLFEALADTGTTSELAARSPSSHPRMEVDSATGTLVRIVADAEEEARFFVGKRGSQFQSIYVREPDSDEVYLLRTRLANLTGRDVDGWRNRTITQLDPVAIHGIGVVGPGRDYELERAEAGWVFTDGMAADSAVVQRMLERFRGLQSSGFASEEELEEADFERPDLTISLTGVQGEPLTTLVLDSLEQDFLLRVREGAGSVFKLARWTVQQIAPADSTLRVSAGGG